MTIQRPTLEFRRICPVLALIMLLSSASSVRAEQPTPESAAPRLFEVFSGLCRDLGLSVTDDEIEMSLESVPCDAKCVRHLEAVRRELVAARGRPVELIIRHALLQSVYFVERDDTSEVGTALLRSDPPRVIDVANKTVMTRSDVIGLINLWRFASGSGAPKHYQPTEDEVREWAAALEAERAKRGRLTIIGVFSAELWLGVKQAWPSLSADERRAVRAYAGQGVRQPLTGAMYARVLGVDRATGDMLRKQEVSYLAPATNRSERTARLIESSVRLGSLPMIWGQVRP
jgi:hypothetical protein